MTQHYLISLSGSSALLPIHPGWGAVESRQRIAAAHRARSGALHAYAWETHFQAAIPLAHVESESRAALEAWWLGQARLAWMAVGPDRIATLAVRLENGAVPLGRRHPPSGTRYGGSMTVQGVTPGAAPVPGAPLILDHATFGTLDTHNLLL